MLNFARATSSSNSSSDRTKARLLALAMHVLFIVLIVFGVTWQKKPQPAIEADLWSNLPPIPQPAPPKVAEQEPVPEPPKPAPPVKVTPAPPPKVEPAPVSKADIALKKKAEKEKKPEPKHEIRPEPKKKEDDKIARMAKEAEDKANAEEAARRDAADKEAKAKAAAERAATASEVQRYIAGIRSKVYGRVALPTDLQGNPEAEFMVSLLPGGELESVTMRKSSGNAAYDAAIERAIRQAQPFSVPTGDVFHQNFRRFAMTFRPQR
jgi:colicin import membrane protein